MLATHARRSTQHDAARTSARRARSLAAALAALATAAGCGGGNSSTHAVAGTLLDVHGQDMSALYQNVYVAQAGVGVNDAIVKVNGVLLAPDGPVGAGHYHAQLPAELDTGAQIVLEVSRGPATVTATSAIPEAPAVTAPPDGSTQAGDVSVAWTSNTDPDRFTVTAGWYDGQGYWMGARFDQPGSARAYTIPSAALPSGRSVWLSVFAYADGVFSGDYLPHAGYPGMNVMASRAGVAIQR